jgi:hypothetical protein
MRRICRLPGKLCSMELLSCVFTQTSNKKCSEPGYYSQQRPSYPYSFLDSVRCLLLRRQLQVMKILITQIFAPISPYGYKVNMIKLKKTKQKATTNNKSYYILMKYTIRSCRKFRRNLCLNVQDSNGVKIRISNK